MKSLTLIVLSLYFLQYTTIAQQLTAKFSADNCYAVYLGDENGVSQKILPDYNSNGVINNTQSKIFNATNVTTQYTPGDWFYVIAWSDDRHCQGLIGEFSGASTLKTGDPGWEVYDTGRDADDKLSDAPDQAEINSFITQANNSGSWDSPVVS